MVTVERKREVIIEYLQRQEDEKVMKLVNELREDANNKYPKLVTKASAIEYMGEFMVNAMDDSWLEQVYRTCNLEGTFVSVPGETGRGAM